jgi:DNA polymerase III epsilon subunit-like protein
MLYNVRLPYTPALGPGEFNERSLIVDTETVGAGAEVEIVEIALGNYAGEIVYHSLVRPAFNLPPRSSKEQRFDAAEFAHAPEWPRVWAELAPLIDNKLLIAYNAAFDRRALAAMCARHGQRSAERGWRCAMQLVKRAVSTKKNLTLGEACALFGLEGGNHRAARDVLATHKLLRTLAAAA